MGSPEHMRPTAHMHVARPGAGPGWKWAGLAGATARSRTHMWCAYACIEEPGGRLLERQLCLLEIGQHRDAGHVLDSVRYAGLYGDCAVTVHWLGAGKQVNDHG